MMFQLWNGDLKSKEELRFIENRGFLYGDGFFETMLYQNGQTKYLKAHLTRIKSACKLANLDWCIDLETLNKNIDQVIKANNLHEATVKLIVWRKEGGLFKADSDEGHYCITVRPLYPSPEIKEELIILSRPYKDFSVLSSYKTLSAINYVLAGNEIKKHKAVDGIILNSKGQICECLYSNIFWKERDTIYTPSLETGCINGIMRNMVIGIAKENGIEIREGNYFMPDILKASSVFTTNIAGISSVKKIMDKTYDFDPSYLKKIRSLIH